LSPEAAAPATVTGEILKLPLTCRGREGGDRRRNPAPQAGRPASGLCSNRRTGCSATGKRTHVGSSASSHLR